MQFAFLLYKIQSDIARKMIEKFSDGESVVWKRSGRRQAIREALIKSTCADLRQKFWLIRKKTAGILTDFKVF